MGRFEDWQKVRGSFPAVGRIDTTEEVSIYPTWLVGNRSPFS
jgi:hypothetical protein